MKVNRDKIRILIPDGENHLTLYVINCLSSVEEVELYVLSAKKWKAIRFSRHVKKFIINKSTRDSDWIDKVNELIEVYAIQVIFPVFEKRIETIINNRSRINNSSAVIELPSSDSFAIGNNKWNLYNYCVENSINVPKSTIHLKETNTIDIPDMWPAIIKPVSGYGGGHGVNKIYNKDQLELHIRSEEYHCDYIIQEYIEGFDIDCNVLCKNGDILLHSIQRGNMKNKSDFMPQLGLEFVVENQFYNLVARLMKRLNWSGLAHIDGRYDVNDGKFKIIEINSRIWMSIDASYLAGINFPEALVQLTLGNKVDGVAEEHFQYLSIKGYCKKLFRGRLKLLKPAFIHKNTQVRFAIKDPLPMVFKFFNRTYNIITNKPPTFD